MTRNSTPITAELPTLIVLLCLAGCVGIVAGQVIFGVYRAVRPAHAPRLQSVAVDPAYGLSGTAVEP